MSVDKILNRFNVITLQLEMEARKDGQTDEPPTLRFEHVQDIFSRKNVGVNFSPAEQSQGVGSMLDAIRSGKVQADDRALKELLRQSERKTDGLGGRVDHISWNIISVTGSWTVAAAGLALFVGFAAAAPPAIAALVAMCWAVSRD